MQRLKSFLPVIDSSSRIIILGSMPGAESLHRGEYYANSRNNFWKIIYAVFGSEPDPSYEKRIRFILSKGIALWDVIESCERYGSLDSGIRDEKCNDFSSLYNSYPEIKCVLFNGVKAYNSYRKCIGFNSADGRVYVKMPSTSPAHAVGFDQKLGSWMIIRELHRSAVQ